MTITFTFAKHFIATPNFTQQWVFYKHKNIDVIQKHKLR